MKNPAGRPPGDVPLSRALSKVGTAPRSDVTRRITAGRVSVDGWTERDPEAPVVPERAAFVIDGWAVTCAGCRLILFNEPRGVVTTRRDPQGRSTVFDLQLWKGTWSPSGDSIARPRACCS
jgi:23S rRNA pseudouridine2605 synthase